MKTPSTPSELSGLALRQIREGRFHLRSLFDASDVRIEPNAELDLAEGLNGLDRALEHLTRVHSYLLAVASLDSNV